MTHIRSLTPEQAHSAGRAARSLLAKVLKQQADISLIKTAIEAVCWTAHTAKVESASLLQGCLNSESVSHLGYECIPTMAEYLPQLIDTDEELALSLIDAIGTLRESREDWVSVGGSRVVPMRVSKHDMLNMAGHHLEEHFEDVLRARPDIGTKAFFRIVDSYIQSKESQLAQPEKARLFDFRGANVELIPDGSFLWAAEGGPHEHDTWSKLTTTFHRVMADWSQQNPAQIDVVLNVYRDHAKWAMLWNQLLVAGIADPNVLGLRITDLLSAVPILNSFETRVSAGKFMTGVYPHLPPTIRSQIEFAVLGIGNAPNEQDSSAAAEQRDRLLGCIPKDLIETAEARSLREEIDARGGAPDNRPLYRIGPARWVSEDEALELRGVKIDAPQNAAFTRVLRELQKFCRHQDCSPSLDDAKSFWPLLKEFEGMLSNAHVNRVDDRLILNAEHYVFGCCKVMSQVEDLHKDSELHAYVRNQLLVASAHPIPTRLEQDDQHWDNSTAAWGSPLPRIDAAEGLMNLAACQETLDGDTLATIERLARDPVNAVRHQIASGLGTLWITANDSFWRLAEHFANNEQRIAILHFFLEVLLRLPRKDVERTEKLVQNIYNRMIDNPKSGPVREECATFFLRRALWDNAESGERFLNEIIDKPLERVAELGTAAFLCRELLTADDESVSENENARIRRWAFDLCHQAFESINRRLIPLLKVAASDVTELQTSQLQSLARLQDRLVHEVYFASEAFDAKQQKRSEQFDLDDQEKRKRFFVEGFATLEAFCKTPLTHTAYTVLETLQHLKPANPRRVFLLIGQLVRSSTGDGIHYDSLVCDRVVELVEQYLSEERGIFRQDNSMLQTLMDLLDLFVDAGWPKAMLLTYRLDEAIRG